MCSRPLQAAPEESGAGIDRRWRPFCSERCKLVDLGRWLDGEYSIPGPPTSPPDGPGAGWDGLDPSPEDLL